jgi:hypothetical protein
MIYSISKEREMKITGDEIQPRDQAPQNLGLKFGDSISVSPEHVYVLYSEAICPRKIGS